MLSDIVGAVGAGVFTHEQVIVQRGRRSGVPIIVALHSTALGQAIGGCRMAHYPDWRDGLTDALRLSAAMSDKCALAGLPNGGGKTVIALPLDRTLSDIERQAALHDAGDVIATLNGAYATGPDVGTDPQDMLTIAHSTRHVFCRPLDAGGSGDSSPHTAAGVLAALGAVCAERFGSRELAGRRFAVLGLGRVGENVARLLAAARGKLIVSDIDDSKRTLAGELGATWVAPNDCLEADVDVLVPAALGGLLSPATVPRLRCVAIAGPANNQLDGPATAELLHQRGILWAPDFIVSAGGIIHATAVELHHETSARAAARVAGIADTLTEVLRAARRCAITPESAARRRARERIRSVEPTM